MGDPFGDIEGSVFDEKEVLTEDYRPESISERDEEIETYRHALSDVLFGHKPTNIMLYGKAGLGKTAVTSYMMDALEKEVEKREEADAVHIHRVNCNGKSLYMTVRELVNELSPPDASPFPERGLATGDAFSELYRQLDRIRGTHLFIFDEIDHLDDVDTLLYELPRASSHGRVENAYIGTIGISNSYVFRERLSPKVKDTLMETEISFTPYDAPALRTILEQRAELGFSEGACDRSAIAKAAAIAARDVGNARQAIDLLRSGGNIADREGDAQVTDDHVERAREEVERAHLTAQIEDQTDHAQYILEAVARLETEGKSPVQSKTVREKYRQVSWEHSTQPLTTLESIRNHLSDLEMMGFLRTKYRNRGRNGGHYNEYHLNMDADHVIETREEIEEPAEY